ncbi:xyloglucan endotransglucosylase/hydrolase protein 9-like protein [Cinnamomum micranthum f. kanehirae]|uniref:Xyloglucan endotransglucosylase/hydrolase n=1 Tax=Cinnamomum micranthum f. kanehirae TaxID=337451 RepID=A0A3S3N1H0_9MAGN|nr:xyloglucan endotransglucosylase/hydrolase protein 9-like protein [Cinnamomum micranthum f. kanehirae]
MKILHGSGIHSSVMHFHVRLLCFWMLFSLAFSANFTDLFQPFWAPDHIVNEDNLVKLTLDNTSGCGIRSRRNYLFGRASVQIKLIEGDSAGTVTAFYMSSDGPDHDELDFEFLGNVSGEPYLVQTNVYVNGTGNREQRHSLWFDPTADFHSYSFLWNRHCIIFLIDGIPIRVFTNKEEEIGVPYPKNQGMGIYGSVWNADDWATQGGSVKTDWSHAPFISAFRSFNIDACEYLAESDGTVGKCREGGLYWWDKPALNSLSLHQSRQLKWVRAKHLVYDYCKDTGRFNELPRECLS